ncbi:MAG TPA: hypothetical protein VIX73_28040, partial [Kofleriaceae bacterium]
MRSYLVLVVGCAIWMSACGFPRPPDVMGNDDGGAGCMVNQSVRCDGSNLVRCNSDGTAEVSDSCSLGCNATALRCNDVAPSNGLGQYLDIAVEEVAIDLGTKATINTDNGTVVIDGTPVAVRSALVAQTGGPTILAFVVHSFKANDVTITGGNAFAVVSNGDIQIGGVFSASAVGSVPSPGGFNDSSCRGGDPDTHIASALSGAGGGGFGLAGGSGGSATTSDGTAIGGTGGKQTGNDSLVPLRGGCDSGRINSAFGSGGGAIQLVARTKITIGGVVAVNGSSVLGGGSGGGVLLEAPTVEVSGTIVANGGAGAGSCFLPQAGENGRLDAMPAAPGLGCDANHGNGGNGGAGATIAGDGVSTSAPNGNAGGGFGGGGVGRIRINTVAG